MLVLGIETSCDETAAAVVEDGKNIRSNIVASQIEFHKIYGGIVPEIASRKHIELLLPVIKEALNKASCTLEDLNGIAVTCGPGLIGSLLIGISFARAISAAKKIPIVGINHLEAHLYAPVLEGCNIIFPTIGLLVSGGHTELIFIEKWGSYKILGQTRDDAAGEAYDKIAKLLNLGYPGGPIIDNLAKNGNPNSIRFSHVKMKSNELDFSFSGLKTAVLYYLKRHKKIKSIEDLVASFQHTLVSMLVKNTIKATKSLKAKTIILCGGVAANSSLRETLKKEASKINAALIYPSVKLCTDNAAMVAGIGCLKLKEKGSLSLNITAKANFPLTEV
jgi:N6-L-threonylcarbamoyladenine synthase